MYCTKCGNDQFKVTDSRNVGQQIRRRRECLQCGERITTYETTREREVQEMQEIKNKIAEYNSVLKIADEMRIELMQSISKYFVLQGGD